MDHPPTIQRHTLREDLGVELLPPQTRIVPVRHSFECLGYPVTRGGPAIARRRWIAHRLSAVLAHGWRHLMGSPYPTRRLIGEGGVVRLTLLLPGLVSR
jgi:hypothetical protein